MPRREKEPKNEWHFPRSERAARAERERHGNEEKPNSVSNLYRRDPNYAPWKGDGDPPLARGQTGVTHFPLTGRPGHGSGYRNSRSIESLREMAGTTVPNETFHCRVDENETAESGLVY